MTYFFAITKDLVVFKIYLKSLVFSKLNAVALRFDIVMTQNGKECNTSLYCLDLAAFFLQIIKVHQCCGFTFTNFLFFLTVTNALATS